MKVKVNNPFFGEGVYSAEITDKCDSSCNGIPILLVEGNPVSIEEARLAEYLYLEPTKNEQSLLEKAGYLM